MLAPRLAAVALSIVGFLPSVLSADAHPASAGQPVTAALRTQWRLAGAGAVKIAVKRDGWYAISGKQLLAAGLKKTVDSRRLHLYADGREVPILVQGGPSLAKDTVSFYGTALNTVSTNTHVYWLDAESSKGRRIDTERAGNVGATQQTAFATEVVREDHTQYAAAVRNGDATNFFGSLVSLQPVQLTLNVPNRVDDPSVKASLRVALQGVSGGPHTVSVQLNGASLGKVGLTGLNAATGTFDLPVGGILSGTNTVTLTPAGVNGDLTLVASLRVGYARAYRASGGVLAFGLQAGRRAIVSGFSTASVTVLDITNPVVPRLVHARITRQGQGYTVGLTAPAGGEQRYLAVALGSRLHPDSVTRDSRSTWNASAHAPDLVIISYHAFIPALAPLVALREKQGLKVAVVDVQDVFDEFSFGAHDPQAIKDFLASAVARWKTPPRYVLLFGHGSLDPRNYSGAGQTDLVPARLIDTSLMETASDDWYVDFDGNGLPDLSLGRIPVRTLSQARTVVGKIVGYNPAVPSQSAVLISDYPRTTDVLNFATSNAELVPLLPQGISVSLLKRAVGSDAVHGQIVQALNSGPRIVNYAGHASVSLWAGNTLTAADALALSNGDRLPIFVMMTCLVGYFIDPKEQSLGEALLDALGGGGVAVWASTGQSIPPGQEAANKAFYRLMFGSSTPLLGDITRQAKAATTDPDVRQTWDLLGDPTMPVR